MNHSTKGEIESNYLEEPNDIRSSECTFDANELKTLRQIFLKNNTITESNVFKRCAKRKRDAEYKSYQVKHNRSSKYETVLINKLPRKPVIQHQNYVYYTKQIVDEGQRIQRIKCRIFKPHTLTSYGECVVLSCENECCTKSNRIERINMTFGVNI